jgi:hypothetical protein
MSKRAYASSCISDRLIYESDAEKVQRQAHQAYASLTSRRCNPVQRARTLGMAHSRLSNASLLRSDHSVRIHLWGLASMTCVGMLTHYGMRLHVRHSANKSGATNFHDLAHVSS